MSKWCALVGLELREEFVIKGREVETIFIPFAIIVNGNSAKDNIASLSFPFKIINVNMVCAQWHAPLIYRRSRYHTMRKVFSTRRATR
jgi:hypothetical protein